MRGAATIAVILLLSAATVAAQPAARIVDATLPVPMSPGRAVATDGHAIYLFGGGSGSPQGTTNWDPSSAILRFNSVDESLEILDAQLPHEVVAAAAVWTGDHFVIMGPDSNRFTGDIPIMWFDPLTETTGTYQSKLDMHRWNGAMLWDGTLVHYIGGSTQIFGANQPPDASDAYRFNPMLDEIVRVPHPPIGSAWFADAVVDGRLWLLNAPATERLGTPQSSDVHSFDPYTEEFHSYPEVMNIPGATAVNSGEGIWMAGGWHRVAGNAAEDYTYDPAAMNDFAVVEPGAWPAVSTVTTYEDLLPVPIRHAGSAWSPTGHGMYIFGGVTSGTSDEFTDVIQCVGCPPPMPPPPPHPPAPPEPPEAPAPPEEPEPPEEEPEEPTPPAGSGEGNPKPQPPEEPTPEQDVPDAPCNSSLEAPAGATIQNNPWRVQWVGVLTCATIEYTVWKDGQRLGRLDARDGPLAMALEAPLAEGDIIWVQAGTGPFDASRATATDSISCRMVNSCPGETTDSVDTSSRHAEGTMWNTPMLGFPILWVLLALLLLLRRRD